MLKCHIFIHLTSYLVSMSPNHLLMYLSWCILILYLFYYFKIVIIWIINMGLVLLKYIECMTYFPPNLIKIRIFYIFEPKNINEYKNVRCHMIWICEDLDTIFLQSIWLCGKMVEMLKTLWHFENTQNIAIPYHICVIQANCDPFYFWRIYVQDCINWSFVLCVMRF